MATAFAGAGEMVDGNNEGTADVFDVARAGVGVVGVVRLGDRDKLKRIMGLRGIELMW